MRLMPAVKSQLRQGETREQRRTAAGRSAATAQLVLDIATAAAGESELDHILLETLDRLSTVVPLTGGSIALVEGEELVVRAAVGPFADEALSQRLRRGPSRSWTVVETLQPYLSTDVKASGLHFSGPRADDALRSWLAIPIVRRGKGIGLLEIDSTLPAAFDQADVALLSTVVRALAGPVELASRYEDERRANALREAFIGVISHELRTPITTIYGLSKMLRQRLESLSPDVRNQAIEDVEAEADRLYRLVEDLLVLSRAERGRVEISSDPIVIAHVLRRAVEAEAVRWSTRAFGLSVDGPLALVLGEETYIEQILRNLLTNAAKYSQAGTAVRVAAGTEDGEVVVRVLDEGIGIPDGDTDELFELFYRSPSASRQAAGAGIGLFVCRQLVEAMGGRIWAGNRDDGGAEVGFALPVHSVEAEIG
jgi:K+-sensing histidine kinase KdpD